MKISILSKSNPVGEVQVVDGINDIVNAFAAQWDEEKATEKIPWWKFWSRSKRSVVAATNFLLRALDNLVNYIDNILDNGPDKKATVLNALEKLYDYVIREAMPIWLRPISGVVKNLILNVIVSSAIDFVVDKYRNGNWRSDLDEAIDNSAGGSD